MPNQVSDQLRSKLAEVLPEETLEGLIELLEATNFPLVEPGSVLEERIHFAIVKYVCDPADSVISESDAEVRFLWALELGETDWRDLLLSAGLAQQNWRQVLMDAGYSPSSMP